MRTAARCHAGLVLASAQFANASASRRFGFSTVAPRNAFHGRFFGSTSTGRASAAAIAARQTAAVSTPFE